MNLKKEFERIEGSVATHQKAELVVPINGENYTRTFMPKERLILLGAGNIAQPLCEFASKLGFIVTVVDDRAKFANEERFPDAAEIICDEFVSAISQLDLRPGDYVCVITRGHKFDGDCLRAILHGTMPGYLGMIGSKRRTIQLLKLLAKEGYEQQRIDQIHTPIGVDIGALTVPEIAISIVAEMIQARRESTDRRSRSRILTNEDIDEKVIRFLAKDETPKAFLLVYETSGSTPVKSGSYMAVDELMRQVGTIGGGCGESAVLHEALELIGTGSCKTTVVEMSNKVASEEGMVCGGAMRVYMADVY